MLSAISGQRMLFNFFRVGGVNFDVNDEFLSRLGTWRGDVLKNIEMNEWMITENEIFTARTKGMGVLTGDEAISLGVTGPNLRASGVPFDVRKAHPYSIYHELEFDVITQQGGDSYARYLQRIAEIKQSIHLIDQIIDKMPHGPVQAQVPGIIRPKPGRAYGGGRVAARPVQRLRHQRRRAEPVSVPDARPELHQPPGHAEAHAGPPRRRHDGGDGQPRPGHGRRGQVADGLGADSLGLGRFVLATTLLLLLTVPTAFVIIQMEMKIIAQLALRYGPNRIGPRGMFQSTIHGFKVLAKEDTVPDQADRGDLHPGPVDGLHGRRDEHARHPVRARRRSRPTSTSASSTSSPSSGCRWSGLLVAGWASYNKYSLLGGLRSAAQMVSYEIPLTLSIVGAVVLAGTLQLHRAHRSGSSSTAGCSSWQPVGLAIFYVASLAEINRTPFDMVEADSRARGRAVHRVLAACASASSSSPSTSPCSS